MQLSPLVARGHLPRGRDISTYPRTGAHNRIRTGDLFLTKEVLYRLSYVGVNLERVMGIEPMSSAWKAEVLPLNYTRFSPGPPPDYCLVEGVGFEPTKA